MTFSLPSPLSLLKLPNVYNPVGRKRTHTLVAKSRARSSRCCGLSSVESHGWEGKKRGHSNWRKLLWRSASLTGKVCKSKNLNHDDGDDACGGIDGNYWFSLT